MMLTNRRECGIQTQLRNGHDRLIAVSADPLNWQGSHPSGHSPNHIPDMWDNGEPEWIPYQEGLPRHFCGPSVFSSGGCPLDSGGDPPGFPSQGPLALPDTLVEILQAPWLPRRRSPRSF